MVVPQPRGVETTRGYVRDETKGQRLC